MDRARVLRTGAHALQPGGHLLIVDHGSTAPWSRNKDPDTHYPTPGEITNELTLDPDQWNVARADMPQRRATGPAGQTATVTDNVLLIQRHDREKLMPPTTRRKRKDTGPKWTAPGEKATLVGFLDYLRKSIMDKVADVPEPEVRTAGVPSGTNLLGLIKHLSAVERFYFLEEPITNMRRTFQPTRDETVQNLLASYRATIAQANQVIETWTDLTQPAPRPPGRGALPPSQRWVLVHMIEEVGRHAGHADILREQIDGSTGR